MSIRSCAAVVLLIGTCCFAWCPRALGQAEATADDAWRQGNEAQPQRPGPAAGDVLPNGQPARPKVIELQPPFMLTAEEDALLQLLLDEWEAKSGNIKTFKCEFTRLEYNPAFMNGNANQAQAESKGELKYAAPDKGLFRVAQSWQYVADAKTGKFNKVPGGPGEYWTCDGKSIYQVDHQQKRVIERPIPPQLQGQAITEGPLPFVFGAKAKSLRQRYYMRVITPPAVAKEQVWLEARPRMQKDAANYSKVELILTRDKMLPYAIQIFDPGANAQNQSRTVIRFDDPSVNNPWTSFQQLFNDFAKPDLFGYKHEVEHPQAAPAAQAADRNADTKATSQKR